MTDRDFLEHLLTLAIKWQELDGSDCGNIPFELENLITNHKAKKADV